jgi:electron transfer flavoprotein beta subunit
VLCGVQSTDAGQQVTGAAVAACVGWPCVTAVTQLEMIWEQRIARVHRDAGAGRTEVVEVELPAVFTVQTGINTPRAPTFKGVMNAKKAPIVLVDPGPDTRERLRALGVAVPPRVQRRLHVIDGGPREVAARLRELLREG